MGSSVCRSVLSLVPREYSIIVAGAGHPGEDDIGGLVLVRDVVEWPRRNLIC